MQRCERFVENYVPIVSTLVSTLFWLLVVFPMRKCYFTTLLVTLLNPDAVAKSINFVSYKFIHINGTHRHRMKLSIVLVSTMGSQGPGTNHQVYLRDQVDFSFSSVLIYLSSNVSMSPHDKICNFCFIYIPSTYLD
jgi:hypothetical protein